MAELRNLTPFANFQFPSWDAKGREFGTFMVKTAWDILPDGSCRLSDEQEPFAFADVWQGEINESALRYASDLVPYKPRMDVLLNATAFAPGGEATAGWTVGVEIRGAGQDIPALRYRMQVTGPRHWVPRWRGWTLSEAEPITSLDLRYEHAYGGTVETGLNEFDKPVLTAFERNPVGRGFALSDHWPKKTPIPAPQILDAADRLTDPFAELAPAGIGPIPAAWLPRRPLGGTYDEEWEETRWPGWPVDYDFAFHNAAPDVMQVPLMDSGDLEFRLKNLHPEREEWTIRLPDPGLVANTVTDGAVAKHVLPTDTVFLDVSADRLGDPRIFVVSRLIFNWQAVDWIILERYADPLARPALQAGPQPADVARDALPEEPTADGVDFAAEPQEISA